MGSVSVSTDGDRTLTALLPRFSLFRGESTEETVNERWTVHLNPRSDGLGAGNGAA